MTLVAGLRAAAYGVPFQPVGGVHGSDLAELNGWRKISDPYGSGQEVYVIPAISPDIAVIHASEVDGVHLDADQHEVLGRELAPVVSNLLHT